jgi:PhoH-like ATPase
MVETKKVILDTNILMNGFDISEYEKVYLPCVVLEELDKHKECSDSDKSFRARRAIRNIKNAENVEMLRDFTINLDSWLDQNKNDNKIIGYVKQQTKIEDDVVFLTSDINLYLKAKALKLPCEIVEVDSKSDITYTGYKEVVLDEYELSVFYECPNNKWGLLNNEYLIIRDGNGDVVDKQRWINGKGFAPVVKKGFKSVMFGDIKPKDVYQECAIDSLMNTEFTALFGYAGSAKTLLSLAYIMQTLQSGKIDRCAIVFSPATLRGNNSLGFYPGDRNQKLMSTSLGGILVSKLGDISMVETLINQGKLMLIPTADIRGIEIGDHSCLYVCEAQNTDIYTMKTILQRAKEGCKIIIEGDIQEQTDLRNCSGNQNGMLRAIEAFKGSKYFSCVNLQKIYRSPIAEIAQGM